MKLTCQTLVVSVALVSLLFAGRTGQAETVPTDGAPLVIPTFHCLGLYWSPPGGAADKNVLVRYRRQGTSEWKEALPMRYNPIPGTDEDLTDYRGSIVHLSPATTYEIELALAGTSTTTNLTATTWSEEFPLGETVRVGDRETPMAITESGTPEAYRVYDGRGATIDVRHRHDNCITIDASYVIVRGLTLKGAGATGNSSSRPIGAIKITGGHDIIIEDCDVSDWGRVDPKTGFGFNYESAVFSSCPTLQRLIIQRCKLHDPSFDGSNWYEPTYPTHSRGPQCISLFNAGGNHVIRYNECWSDMDHMYIFHNTIFASDQWLPTGGLGGNRIVKRTVSRNNILHVRTPQNHSISNDKRNIDNDYDYDLFNGQIPPGQEAHGVRGEPIYADDAGLDSATRSGHFHLTPGSPGASAGQVIPNFSHGYTGEAPDIGAHQRGSPPMRYGTQAGQR